MAQTVQRVPRKDVYRRFDSCKVLQFKGCFLTGLKKIWNAYRVEKSRSDHFGYKSILINGYPHPSEDDLRLMDEYHKKHMDFYIASCHLLTPEFIDCFWEDDGSCVLKDGTRLQY